MKLSLYHSILLVCIILASCKKDNYAPPSSMLSGRLVYQGDAIGVEYDKVPFELYQYGFGKVGAIGETFTPDGSYSMLLFDGEYKFIIPNGQGPFMWEKTASGAADSLTIVMKGSQTLDIEVTPYYMIRNPQITGSGSSVSATFELEKIITDANAKDVESVSLFINKTQFVSPTDKIGETAVASGDIADLNNISLQVAVPEMMPTQNYVYASIGVKIAGVEDVLLSPVVKITL